MVVFADSWLVRIRRWMCSRYDQLEEDTRNLQPGAPIPQPNIGAPGTGDLILNCWGEEGVVGRAAISGFCVLGSPAVSHEVPPQVDTTYKPPKCSRAAPPLAFSQGSLAWFSGCLAGMSESPKRTRHQRCTKSITINIGRRLVARRGVEAGGRMRLGSRQCALGVGFRVERPASAVLAIVSVSKLLTHTGNTNAVLTRPGERM